MSICKLEIRTVEISSIGKPEHVQKLNICQHLTCLKVEPYLSTFPFGKIDIFKSRNMLETLIVDIWELLIE